MTKKIITQTSFTSGEVSAILDGRVDTAEYSSALDSAINATVLAYGPVRRRNGSKFIAETKYSSFACRLLRFQFSQDVAYILELGNQYIRFYKDTGQIYSSGTTPYEIVSPYTTAYLPDIQTKQKGNVIYLVHPSVAPQKLNLNADLTWSIAPVVFTPPPTYEVGVVYPGATLTPSHTTGLDRTFTTSGIFWKGADVGRQIKNVTPGETGIATITSITSGTIAVGDILEDFTDTNTLDQVSWNLDLSPICDLEFDGFKEGSIINIRTVYTAGTLGNRVSITGITKADPAEVTTSGNHGLSSGNSIQIDDVVGMGTLNDKIFNIEVTSLTSFTLVNENSTGYPTYISGGILRKRFDGLSIGAFRPSVNPRGTYILANGGVLDLVSINSESDVDALVVKSMNSKESTGAWSLELPTWNSTRGYPRSIGLFDQRLIFGGTATQTQTLWLSEIGLYDSFGVGPDDEDSIEVEIDSSEVNQINWLAESRDLIIGTSGGELTLTIDASSVIPKVTPRTYYGSKLQQVAQIKDEILFVQGAGTKLRTFKYDFNIDTYTGEDLTFLAEHIAKAGIKEIAYAQEPYSIIYAVTNDGELLSGTYDRSKKVIGWTKNQTDGHYENVQTITKGSEDQVWVTVKRTVGGSTKRYVEVILFGSGEDDVDGFSDSYLTLSTPKTISSISLANPAVVTASSHGYSNGNTVIIKDLIDDYVLNLDTAKSNMSSLNNKSWVIAGVTTHQFQLVGLDTSTSYNAYHAGGESFKKVQAVSGLSHLEGKTVQVKIDGSSHPDEVVTAGIVTLDRLAGEVTVGLPYRTTITTKPHEFDIGIGSMQGQRVRWARPTLRVNKSLWPLLNEEYIPSRNTLDPTGVKIPLYSGIVEYGPLNWSNTSALSIVINDPLPLTLVSIQGTIEAGVK